MFETLSPPKVILVPAWIYRRIIRNKLNIVDMNCYKSMRQILSITDLAEWRHLNDEYKIKDCYLSSGFLFSEGLNQPVLSNNKPTFINGQLSDEEINEFRVNILPLSTSKEIIDSCNDKLNSTAIYGGSGSIYKFILHSDNVLYIIINEGFNYYIGDKDRTVLLSFIREYIRNASNMMVREKVVQLSAYNLYLKELAIS